MKFTIIEVDNDYRCFVNATTMEFKSLKDAQDWCEKESWTGLSYYVEKPK